MKNKIGTLLVILGGAALAGALGLFLFNTGRAAGAEQFAREAVPALVEQIALEQREPEASQEPPAPAESAPAPEPAATEPLPAPEMGTIEIDGISYIGILSIPSLELELPVMADWSTEALRLSPCLYSGSLYDHDLVLMAHNYRQHFGRLSRLQPGDLLWFLDAEGVRWDYQVSVIDVLASTAVEEMQNGKWPLTLFTCSFGGESRIAVRCDTLSAGYAQQDFKES